MEKLKKEIERYLSEKGKATVDDIQDALNSDYSGLRGRDINQAINEMKSNGQIQEYTYYGLRPKGCAKVPETEKTIKKVSDFISPSSDN